MLLNAIFFVIKDPVTWEGVEGTFPVSPQIGLFQVKRSYEYFWFHADIWQEIHIFSSKRKKLQKLQKNLFSSKVW